MLGLGLSIEQVAVRRAGGGAPAPNYAPSFVQTDAQLIYSTVRATPGATNMAQVERASDSTTMDIPFQSGATAGPDLSTYNTFVSGTTTGTTKLYDQTANANDGTSTSKPLFTPTNAIRGKQTISMGYFRGGTFGTARVALPAIANNRSGVTILAVVAPPAGSYNSIGFFGLGVDANPNNNLSLYRQSDSTLNVVNSGFNSVSGAGFINTGQPSVIVYNAASSGNFFRLNGVSGTAGGNTAQALSGGWVGGASWSSATDGPNHFLFFAVIPRVITSTEAAAFETWAAAAFDINLAPSNGLWIDGDSIPAGILAQTFGRTLQFYTAPLLNARVHMPTRAVAGDLMQSVFNRRNGAMSSAYSATRAKNNILIMAGTNDAAALVTQLGDSSVKSTTATATSGATTITVADATGIAVGQSVSAVRLYGAGVAANGSTSLTVNSTAGLQVGMIVSGPAGIPSGAYITAIAGNVVTLSTATTAAVETDATNHYSVALTFGSGFASGATVTAVSGATITISSATTAALNGEPVKFGARTTASSASSASTTLNVTSSAGMAVGNYVKATGVPFGTTISSIAGNVLTLSGNATVANAAVVTAIDPAIVNSYTDSFYNAYYVGYVATANTRNIDNVTFGTIIKRGASPDFKVETSIELFRLRLNTDLRGGTGYLVADFASLDSTLLLSVDLIHPIASDFAQMAPVLAAQVNTTIV